MCGVACVRTGGRAWAGRIEVRATMNRRGGSLAVTVIRCTGLLSADANGMSDPYVKLGLSAPAGATRIQPARTKTQETTLNPMFGETFLFSVAAGDCQLTVEVMDADTIGKDEFIGHLVVDVADLLSGWRQPEVQQVFKISDEKVSPKLLKKCRDDVNPCGSVELRLAFTGAAKLRPPSDGVVSVTVVGCRGLLAADFGGKSDPYVTVGVGAGGPVQRTKTVAGSLDPSFEESFAFSVRAEGPPEAYRLAIEVKDADRFGKDDYLGLFAMDIGSAFGGADWRDSAVSRWFDLGDGHGTVSSKLLKKCRDDVNPCGSVELRLAFTGAAKVVAAASVLPAAIAQPAAPLAVQLPPRAIEQKVVAPASFVRRERRKNEYGGRNEVGELCQVSESPLARLPACPLACLPACCLPAVAVCSSNDLSVRSSTAIRGQALGIPFIHATQLNEYEWFDLKSLSSARLSDMVAAGVPPPFARKLMNAVRRPALLHPLPF